MKSAGTRVQIEVIFGQFKYEAPRTICSCIIENWKVVNNFEVSAIAKLQHKIDI